MNMMRKHLKPPGVLLAIILSLALAILFVKLHITKDKHVVDDTVTKVSLNHGVNLNKPIIDISGWQLPSEMDYDTLSQQINGVIVRVQHGISMKKKNNAADQNGKDKAMDTHIQEFQKRNIPVAVYAFVNGKSEAEMRKEAKKFYERAEKYKPTYWWLDVEEVTMKQNFNQGIEAFRNELAKLGAKHIGIYTQDWFITANQLDVTPFSSVWLAHYGGDTGYWDTSPDTTVPYDLHQYTSRGRLNGFAGDLDFNRVSNIEDYNKLFNHGQLIK
jgi:lysozyme